MAVTQKTKDSANWWELWGTTEEVDAMEDIDFIEDQYSKEIYSIEEILQRSPSL